MKTVFLFFTVLSLSPAHATLTVGNLDCPEQFEGKVKEIIKEVGSDRPFATQKVLFENHRTLKGEVKESVQLDILAHGPFEIVPGEDYRVQVRKGKLCWIERL